MRRIIAIQFTAASAVDAVIVVVVVVGSASTVTAALASFATIAASRSYAALFNGRAQKKPTKYYFEFNKKCRGPIWSFCFRFAIVSRFATVFIPFAFEDLYPPKRHTNTNTHTQSPSAKQPRPSVHTADLLHNHSHKIYYFSPKTIQWMASISHSHPLKLLAHCLSPFQPSSQLQKIYLFLFMCFFFFFFAVVVFGPPRPHRWSYVDIVVVIVAVIIVLIDMGAFFSSV